MNRRKFLKWTGCVTAATGLTAAASYPFLEAKRLKFTFASLRLPKLPQAFEGTSIAFLSDLHHGPYVSLSYLRSAIAKTAELKPDLILLGGDYVSKSPKFIDPVFSELRRLNAPLGKFGVLGNHDHWESESQTRAAMLREGVIDLTNRGVWIEKGDARIRVGGVGDLWCDHQFLDKALGDATDSDASIVLSHNPDFVEKSTDPRVGLFLSGHTHGGQVFVPGYGAPVVPSAYGQKYRQGLVQGPISQVYVSRGVGTSGPPIRSFCRPEVVMIQLLRA